MSTQLTQAQNDLLMDLSGVAFKFYTPTEIQDLVNAGYVETNPTGINAQGQFPARVTTSGQAYLSSLTSPSTSAPQPWGVPIPFPVTADTSAPQTQPSFVSANTEAPVQAPVAAPAPVDAAVPAKKVKKPKAHSEVAVDPNAPAPVYTITDVPLPASKKRAFFQETKYPFADVDLNKTFFVPNTPDCPDAARRLQSAASAANARFSEATSETRTTPSGKVIAVRKPLRKFEVRKDVGRAEDGAGMLGKEGARVGRVL